MIIIAALLSTRATIRLEWLSNSSGGGSSCSQAAAAAAAGLMTWNSTAGQILSQQKLAAAADSKRPGAHTVYFILPKLKIKFIIKPTGSLILPLALCECVYVINILIASG